MGKCCNLFWTTHCNILNRIYKAVSKLVISANKSLNICIYPDKSLADLKTREEKYFLRLINLLQTYLNSSDHVILRYSSRKEKTYPTFSDLTHKQTWYYYMFYTNVCMYMYLKLRTGCCVF